MLIRVLHPFSGYIENQIIDTAVEEIDATGLLAEKHVEIVYNSQKLIDNVSDNLVYIGEANPNALDSESVWTITKVLTVGTVIKKTTHHDKKWAERNLL